MYLGLRAPWRGGPTTVATATPDAGDGSGSASAKKKKKGGGKRRTAGGDPGGGGGDDGYGGTAEEIEETEPAIVLTDADRRMEWRGDEIGLPPKVFDMGDGKETRALVDGEMSATMSRRGGAMIDCVVMGASGTDLVASITLKLAVSGEGKVGKVKVQAPHYLFEHGLLACARRAAARFDFPATGAGTLVTAPFELGR